MNSVKKEVKKRTEPRMISIIVPLFNEALVLQELYERITAALTRCSYEVLFVDDGSTDETGDAIKKICRIDQRIKLVRLSRNFGHQAAFFCGVKHAAGDVVVMMDGDLQDPPEMILAFLEKWKDGYDVVYGVRKKRKENIIIRAMYHLFYRLLRSISDIHIPVDSGDFSLIDRKVIDIIAKSSESSLFIRGIRAWSGFRQTGVPLERSARVRGAAKYSFAKLVKLAFDGIFSFSNKPLYVLSALGLLLSSAAIIAAIWVIVLKLVWGIPLQGWASLIVSIAFLSGLIIFSQGILGIYIARIFEQVKHRPLYIVEEKVNV